MELAESTRDSRYMAPPEAERCRNPQVTTDDIVPHPQCVRDVIELFQHGPRAVEQQPPLFGEPQVPRTAIDQATMETRLDLAQVLCDRGSRDIERTRGGCERGRARDDQKEPQIRGVQC